MRVFDGRIVPAALTIAGSDSGGGAGIQADLKTFAFHCVHGTAAITCVTAQNTLAVERVDVLAAVAVSAQIQAVVKDIPIGVAKTGMLVNSEIMAAVAREVKEAGIEKLVVDPVMVSRAGAPLIDSAAIATLKNLLIPQALVVTPNRYEAEILSGLTIETLEDAIASAQKIHQLGAKATIVKGGAMTGKLRGIDVWFDGQKLEILTKGPAIETRNTHGTGCTLSAAIAANLALGQELLPAAIAAKDYVTLALENSLAIGKGCGPLGHFFPLFSEK